MAGTVIPLIDSWYMMYHYRIGAGRRCGRLSRAVLPSFMKDGIKMV